MPFDIAYWKAAIKAYLPKAKKDFKRGVYNTLGAATFLPLLIAYQNPENSTPALMALWNILSGVGSNILAGKLQAWGESKTPDLNQLAAHLQDSIEKDARVRKELDALLEKLETIDQTHAALKEKDKAWFQQTLQQELKKLKSNLRIIYTESYFENVNLHHGDFVARDKIIYIYQGEDVTPLVDSYFRNLSARCQVLPLGIIDEKYINPQGSTPIKLQDIYTDLDVAAIHKEKEEDPVHFGWRLSRAEEGDREPILEAIAREELPCMTLLGNAGSGKTTFINYLTYRLLSSPEGLPESLRDKPVIRLILRDVLPFLSSSAQTGTAGWLWNALEADIRKRIGNATAQKVLLALQLKVAESPCLLLLDGLDEIPEANKHRQHLIQAVQDLVNSVAEGSRVILTARPYAYAQPEWQLPAFTALTLKPFNESQAEHFITAWYHCIPSPLDESAKTLQTRAESLINAIQEKEYLGAMASRPILLTLMTTLHTSRGTLPEDRAELYNDSVDLLINRWQQKYRTSEADTNDETQNQTVDPRIMQVFRFGTAKVRKVMEAIAYASHLKQQKRQTVNPDASQQSADITRAELESAFNANLPDDLNARVVVDYLAQNAGLLIAREPGIFIFPHRSFQEFLAACHILNQPESTRQLLSHVRDDLNWWREVYLLAVGRQNCASLDNAVSLISALKQASLSDNPEITDQDWQEASLAGEGLLELRLLDDPEASKAYQGLIRRIRGWLTRLVEEGHLDPKTRLKAGDTLGQIGDFRKGINVITRLGKTIPDIDWVYVPEGEFLMGSTDYDKYAFEEEKPQHSVYLPAYWISRYPITNAQFAPFVDEKCYENQEYWIDAGWEWLEEIRRIREEEPYKRPIRYPYKPYGWKHPRRGIFNRPVVGISWYEAHAYSLWLQEKYWESNFSLGIEKINYIINIPSEEQWEKAIRGVNGLIYPWGNNWTFDTANIKEENLHTISTLGMFPKGKSKGFGLLDGVGNINEWTSTSVGNHPDKPIFNYPHHLDSGFNEDKEKYDFFIVRGCCELNNKYKARCAYRGVSVRLVWGLNFGFRLCLIKG